VLSRTEHYDKKWQECHFNDFVQNGAPYTTGEPQKYKNVTFRKQIVNTKMVEITLYDIYVTF